MSDSSLKNKFEFILVEPSHPGNIGATARAIKNMGFQNLSLINPKNFPNDDAFYRAKGAKDILENVKIYENLSLSIKDATFVFGTSARTRTIPWPTKTSSELSTILKNAIDFANRIGIGKPKVSVLSATEEVLDSMPSSLEANELTKRAKEEGLNVEVFGPMAFDNSVSEKAAQIKGIKNAVAGKTDILLVPNVETGNALVKMMIFFMGACAAGVVVGGKVPVVITSRADDTQARLASMAAAVVAL